MRTDRRPLRGPALNTALALLTAVILTLSSGLPALAADTGRLAVFPFAVNAPAEFDYLGRDIPSLLRDELQARGFELVAGEKIQAVIANSGKEELNSQAVKNLALQANADYAVYGSVSQLGDNLSLDIRLLDPLSMAPPKAFYATAQGLINLQPALSGAADKLQNSLQRRTTISEINVRGNKTLGEDVVLMRLNIQEGDPFSAPAIDEEVKRLYATGYFDDIRVHADQTPEGVDLTFEVRERPLLSGIEVRGNEELGDDDILEAMSTKPDSVLNPKILSQDLDTIRELYRKEGYYQAKIDYSREQTAAGQAKLIVDVQEGDKQYITEIRIKGAQKLDQDELKDELALSERGLFSWITGGGVLREEALDRDAAALEAYYANRGFMDVRVGQPEVSYQDDGIHVIFQVQEGPRYKVGSVDFDGELIAEQEQLLEVTEMDNMAREEEPFSRSTLRDDVQALTDFYSNYGYAFAEASPNLRKNPQEKTIDIKFSLTKKQQVYINRVTVSGNTKTRDNVIRRNLYLTEGDRFSGQRLKFSRQRLVRSDYFEDVQMETSRTADPELMDINVKVKEKSTGSFSAGAGYSSVDNVFFTGRIQERNLFGKGYNLSFQGTLGGSTTRYMASFWNPHLYDGPLGAGVDLYNIVRDYDDYDLDTTGGKMKFAYSVGTYTRLFWNYSLQEYQVSDIDADASDDIKDLEGSNLASKAAVSLTRDTTNRRLNPSRGTKNTLGVEYAGGILGGDDSFIKPEYEFSYFHPLFWKAVFNWHWKAGWIFETEDEVPDYERFYLGGINTVRGYDYRDICITDQEGDDIGGYKSLYTNLELIFPIKDDMGLLGVLFFDAGDVWDKNETIELDLYKSVGAGIRWNSPMGPLRLEYGYPLDDLEDNNGQFEFTVGQAF
ncbi:outer membrane protein assembly factor BamA [Desulfovermiculus halophilus]|uniref:outer membrane protein assembly factor BamA n=1 Tax=Desulfovermiculus halophilus TaxID=339722 RepID=UPI00068584D3|nr:outer membrane protein assembly factor BamA [Desulfovermiculus halophilus]